MSRVSRLSSAAKPAGVLVEHLVDYYSRYLDNRRTIRVFLPGSYHQPGQKDVRYKVVYANDGQDMESVGLAPTLSRLYSQGKLAPLILVAIPINDDRVNEYGTAGILNSDGLGAKAQEYQRFVLQEVMPHINASYRVLPGPENTAIMGWSLGGLSAFDTAWRHPDVFGVVAVFSGSFWWCTDGATPSSSQASRIMHRVVRHSKKRRDLRMWFEAGTLDEASDRDGDGVIDAIQDTTELMDVLALKGHRRGRDMVFVQVEGGQHDQATWGTVLPDFLTWAFPHQ